jgi:hypothetical protein
MPRRYSQFTQFPAHNPGLGIEVDWDGVKKQTLKVEE